MIESTESNTAARLSQGGEEAAPFLRWAGGKRWLVPFVRQLLPRSFNCYFEPFLGGGSMFFSVRPQHAVLSDINQNLIEMYQAVRDDADAVHGWIKHWPNTKRTYYTVRNLRLRNRYKRAAQLIYLNRTCWNGLYRVNTRGQFNVPYGRTRDRQILDQPKFFAAGRALAKACLRVADFQGALDGAGAEDVVYLDPPFTGLHANNGFIRYNERLFSWEDQVRLAKTAVMLANKGCHVIVSNALHDEVTGLYAGFQRLGITRPSRIAAQSAHRRDAQEVVLLSPSLRLRVEA